MRLSISPLTRIDASGDCWMWTGAIDRDGYGKHSSTTAHRAVYQTLVGPIPAGMTIDHLCRVRACVNPDHLEVVTNRENIARGFGITSAGHHRQPLYRVPTVTCKRGHAREQFTYTAPDGRRNCRECNRLIVADSRSRRS